MYFVYLIVQIFAFNPLGVLFMVVGVPAIIYGFILVRKHTTWLKK